MARSSKDPFTVETLTLRAPRSDEVHRNRCVSMSFVLSLGFAPVQVKVRIVASGLCHTDVVCKKEGFLPFPIVLGHGEILSQLFSSDPL